jgi:Tfp pilus assembly protein PilX
VKSRQSQRGITLVVSLIMLIVLTLLVVSAIRFGNINLKISGNAQTDAEASAAAQVGVEQMVQAVVAADKIDSVPATPALVVSTGGTQYTVNVSKPACILSKNVVTTDLDPTKATDVPCFEGSDTEKLVSATGSLTSSPTACKDQQWDIAATVADASSGASVNMLQGVALRVPAQVQCP